NFLSNAIKYNCEQGKVEVTCEVVTPGRLRISIIDTGAGLPPEQLAQLFQPFNRLGQESGAEEGTGIGLVVAKQLIELMRGAIGVESTIGKGSVFWFELMVSAKPQFAGESGPAETLADEPAVPTGGRVRNVLYVEDNLANLKLVEQLIMTRSDLRLLSAETGHLGIKMAHAYQPEVVLMDINLPDISGYDVLSILAKDVVTARIPVIALSANAMPYDIQKGLRAGFFRYITKPIKIAEFMETLNAALQLAEERTDELKEAGATV
ncbi:MAG: ATP-binding protein, partial [bacterium]|nr:ATP-binding protein [bacterium]